MRLSEVMTPARSCRPSDAVRDCAKIMRDENIGFVPICDDDGKPIGAVTDRDLAVRVLAEGKGGDEKVERFMTRSIASCRLDDDASAAQRLMGERQVSRVMVCDERGVLHGVVSLQDVAEVESDASAGRTLGAVKSERAPSP